MFFQVLIQNNICCDEMLRHIAECPSIIQAVFLFAMRKACLHMGCRVCRDVGCWWIRFPPLPLSVSLYPIYTILFLFIYKIRGAYIHTLPSRDRSVGKSDEGWKQPYIPTHPTLPPSSNEDHKGSLTLCIHYSMAASSAGSSWLHAFAWHRRGACVGM